LNKHWYLIGVELPLRKVPSRHLRELVKWCVEWGVGFFLVNIDGLKERDVLDALDVIRKGAEVYHTVTLVESRLDLALVGGASGILLLEGGLPVDRVRGIFRKGVVGFVPMCITSLKESVRGRVDFFVVDERTPKDVLERALEFDVPVIWRGHGDYRTVDRVFSLGVEGYCLSGKALLKRDAPKVVQRLKGKVGKYVSYKVLHQGNHL